MVCSVVCWGCVGWGDGVIVRCMVVWQCVVWCGGQVWWCGMCGVVVRCGVYCGVCGRVGW